MGKLILRPYQSKAVNAILELKPGIWRKLLVMPTAGGKTLIMIEVLRRSLKPGESALILVPRDEILTQTKEEVERHFPEATCDIEKAEQDVEATTFDKDTSRPHIVIGSVASMRGRRLRKWSSDTFHYVVIDEAHHSTAVSYRNILEYFGVMDNDRRTPLLGVTATPTRTDRVGLDHVYQEVPSNNSIKELSEDGFLCRITPYTVRTEVDIIRIAERVFGEGESSGGSREEISTKNGDSEEQKIYLIASAHRKLAWDRPTIIFCWSVASAEYQAEVLNDLGVSTEVLTGEMPIKKRRAILEKHKSGEIKVLTHYSVLLEGFDSPPTSCLIFARNTKSDQLVTQAIGRGMRLHNGKKDLLLLDMTGRVKSLCQSTIPKLYGLSDGFPVEGEDVLEVSSIHDRVISHDPSLKGKIKTKEELISLMTKYKLTTKPLPLPKENRRLEDKEPIAIEIEIARTLEEQMLIQALGMKYLIAEWFDLNIPLWERLRIQERVVEEALVKSSFAA
jgi:superfamily II DNA or RNA helicase